MLEDANVHMLKTNGDMRTLLIVLRADHTIKITVQKRCSLNHSVTTWAWRILAAILESATAIRTHPSTE